MCRCASTSSSPSAAGAGLIRWGVGLTPLCSQWRNNQSITPALDRLRGEGIEVREFYTYKFCAP